jgi:transglutaminase-like putative cysteine protease
MLKYDLGCDLNYSIFQESTLILNIAVVRNDYQTIFQEEINVYPATKIEEYIDPACHTRYFRLNAHPGNLHISYRARLGLSHRCLNPNLISEVTPADLPLEMFSYLYPSRYCQSDLLLRFALTEFGHLFPGYSRVTAICNWIYDNLLYLSGSSNSLTSACDTALERVGVCRDFAHLGIALCRALNIPARFVSGYAYGLIPSDFHAVFEAYLDGRWYLFDPTRLVPLKSVVRVGTGRDAADVSFATIFGLAQMNEMRLFMDYLPDAHQTLDDLTRDGTEGIAIA